MNETDRIVEQNRDTFIDGINKLLAGAALHQHVPIDNLDFGGIVEDDLTHVERARADLTQPTNNSDVSVDEAFNDPDHFLHEEATELYNLIGYYGNDVGSNDTDDDGGSDEEDG